MYLAGVSMRRVESITKILWRQKVSAGNISNLNQIRRINKGEIENENDNGRTGKDFRITQKMVKE